MAHKRRHEIRIGLVKVTVTETGPINRRRHSCKLERLFRDGDIWRSSSRLDLSSLLIAAKALEMAFEHIDSIPSANEQSSGSPTIQRRGEPDEA